MSGLAQFQARNQTTSDRATDKTFILHNAAPGAQFLTPHLQETHFRVSTTALDVSTGRGIGYYLAKPRTSALVRGPTVLFGCKHKKRTECERKTIPVKQYKKRTDKRSVK